MPTLFSVKAAAAITGVSPQSIRSYTGTYARYLSTEATPAQGKERKFTRDDLRLIKFVYQAIGRGNVTHEQVQQQLEQGDLDSFDWEPQDAPSTASDPPQDAGSYLVPVAQLQAAQALMLDAQAREQQAIQREQALQTRIEQMQRDMGKLEGELSATKASKPKGFWARLFGGGE